MMKACTLYELNIQIKRFLKHQFPDSLWITAEIAEVQMNRSGHCYLQLVDKRENEEGIIATARATIWASLFRTLRPYFETTTGRTLEKGIHILLNVEVVFHELYGYSLNVKDIDPTYTVGDLERKKQEILKRLEQDGIINMNRDLEFPVLPKNIAVISSPTAAGLGDFINQLQNNIYGYRFHIKVFPAVMQGEKTATSVIGALEKIYANESLFDVVVVVRGGGSQVDLGSFDNYEIAANIAQFPLPVLTGIGHERDLTIADRVAHLYLKTPTAVAAFLIETFHEQEILLHNLQKKLVEEVQEVLRTQIDNQLKMVLNFRHMLLSLLASHRASLMKQFPIRVRNGVAWSMERENNRLEAFNTNLRQRAQNIMAKHQRLLELAANTVKYVDPVLVLKRGYSITRLNGKAVKSIEILSLGDCLETELSSGRVMSKVVKSEIS